MDASPLARYQGGPLLPLSRRSLPAGVQRGLGGRSPTCGALGVKRIPASLKREWLGTSRDGAKPGCGLCVRNVKPVWLRESGVREVVLR